MIKLSVKLFFFKCKAGLINWKHQSRMNYSIFQPNIREKKDQTFLCYNIFLEKRHWPIDALLDEYLMWFVAVFVDLKNVCMCVCIYVYVLYVFIWANKKNNLNEACSFVNRLTWSYFDHLAASRHFSLSLMKRWVMCTEG